MSDLQKAGSACARLWTGGPACRLINQVIMRDERDACDSIMPMIRCLTNYLLEKRGELMANLTVYRTSRLRRKSTTHLAAGSAYRIGMFVATSTRREAIQQLAEWQGGETGFRPKVSWVFTVPAGCQQVRDIRSVSRFGHDEDEVTMVPYTAVRIDRKESSRQGTTIYATVLRDSSLESEALPTILA